MRRALWVVVLFVALVGWVAGGALLSEPPSAGAQSPGVSFGHIVDGQSVPTGGNQPFYIVAIGSDARPGVCEPVEACLADSIHLIGVNPKEESASILGFPRDSYVNIPGFGTQKINNALAHGGPELVAQTVAELVGVEIDYYLLTSFEGLRHMVEDLGGIEVEIPYAMSDSASGATFEAGPATLDGRQALAFARNRKSTPNGDFSRSENQGLLIMAALEQLRQDVRRDPLRLLTWIVIGLQNIQTDLTLAEVFDLMLTALAVDPKDVVNEVTPGGIGSAGAASIVTLGGEADAMFADIADDGVLEASEAEETEEETTG
ncbi:MAG: LCP family protein [Actinomycetota bacterium]